MPSCCRRRALVKTLRSRGGPRRDLRACTAPDGPAQRPTGDPPASRPARGAAGAAEPAPPPASAPRTAPLGPVHAARMAGEYALLGVPGPVGARTPLGGHVQLGAQALLGGPGVLFAQARLGGRR